MDRRGSYYSGLPPAPQQDRSAGLQRQGEGVVLREWAWETQHETLGSPPPARWDESSFPNLSPWSSLKTLILQPLLQTQRPLPAPAPAPQVWWEGTSDSFSVPSPIQQAGPGHLIERSLGIWGPLGPQDGASGKRKTEKMPLRGEVLGKEGKEEEGVAMF